MRHWLYTFRGAFLTWATVPVALLFFAYMGIAWAVAASYHPMAPIAFQFPYFLALAILTALALLALALRHATKARRGRFGRNLAELLALAAGFALIGGGVILLVTGPKTQERLLFGETYWVPTAYRPVVVHDGAQRDLALIVEVCGPDDAPIYSVSGCRDPALVRYGRQEPLEDFELLMFLVDEGAVIEGERLVGLGRHKSGPDPRSAIYSRAKQELRLWLDESERVVVSRFCDLAYRVDCKVLARLGDRTMIFPVHDMASTETLPNLLAAAEVWVTRIEGWRCPEAVDCIAK